MRTSTGTLATLVLLAAATALLGQNAPASPQGGLTVDREKKEILIPCKIAPRKLPNLPEIYPVEVIATWPAPKGQKAHETVVNFDAKPSDVHKALESLGLKAGKPGRGEDGVASGAELDLSIEVTDKAGAKKRIPLETVLADKQTGKPFPPLKWLFTGSSMKQVDPNKPDQTYAADLTGTLVGLYPVTDELVIQTNLTMREEGAIKIEVAKGLLPAEGTAALLVVKPAGPRPPPTLPVLSPRAAAELAVLRASDAIAVQSGRPAPLTITPPPPVTSVDPFRHRRDVPSGSPTVDEARPIALPLPPIPVGK
jgi:hypothetical protein